MAATYPRLHQKQCKVFLWKLQFSNEPMISMIFAAKVLITTDKRYTNMQIWNTSSAITELRGAQSHTQDAVWLGAKHFLSIVFV